MDVDGGQNLVFSIQGGADAGRFVVDPVTGVLSFVSPPDFEAASDAGRDNIYDVVVQVSDGTLSDTQAPSVRVRDDAEAPPPAVPAPGPAPAPAPAEPAPQTQTPRAPPSAAPPAGGTPGPATAAPGRTSDVGAELFAPPGASPAAAEPMGFQGEASGFRVPEIPATRAAHTIVVDRAALDLIAVQAPVDLMSLRFGVQGGTESGRLEELQRSLRSEAFASELDRMRQAVREDLDLEESVTISVASVSLGLSLVYVLWLIRGGVLLGSYLSALPAWRILDPLPVLSRVEEEHEDEDEPIDDGGSDGRNTLRGFG
jgi:hypothetical protein